MFSTRTLLGVYLKQLTAPIRYDLSAGDSLLENAKEHLTKVTESMGNFFSGDWLDAHYPVPEEIEDPSDIEEYIEEFSKNRYGIMARNYSKKSVISMCELYGREHSSGGEEVKKIFSAISNYGDVRRRRWHADHTIGEYIERCSMYLELEEPLEDGTEEIELKYSR